MKKYSIVLLFLSIFFSLFAQEEAIENVQIFKIPLVEVDDEALMELDPDAVLDEDSEMEFSCFITFVSETVSLSKIKVTVLETGEEQFTQDYVFISEDSQSINATLVGRSAELPLTTLMGSGNYTYALEVYNQMGELTQTLEFTEDE